MPHSPWPHDMVTRVEDAPQHLTVLLFIRDADTYGTPVLTESIHPANRRVC